MAAQRGNSISGGGAAAVSESKCRPWQRARQQYERWRRSGSVSVRDNSASGGETTISAAAEAQRQRARQQCERRGGKTARRRRYERQRVTACADCRQRLRRQRQSGMAACEMITWAPAAEQHTSGCTSAARVSERGNNVSGGSSARQRYERCWWQGSRRDSGSCGIGRF